MKTQEWVEYIRKMPAWIKAAIAFLAAIVGFAITFKDNVYLVTTVVGLVLFSSTWLSCFYISVAKTRPLLEGGKGVYRFPTLRPWGLVGTIAIPSLALIILSFPSTRSFIRVAVVGPPRATSTPTGPILANAPQPAPTYIPPEWATQVIAVATAGTSQSVQRQAKLAYEDYAWLDYPFWPVSIGAPADLETGGELGVAPWIAIEVRLINPSDKETQTISEATLHVNSFEPVDTGSGHTITINASRAPYYLIPEECNQDSVSSPLGPQFSELPQEGRLLGVLPTDTSQYSQMKKSGTVPPNLAIEPNGTRDYILLISAGEPGKYEFSVNLSFVATDFATSEIKLDFSYAFLDAKTALAMPRRYMGPECP